MWGGDLAHLFANETFSLMDQLMEKFSSSPEPFKKLNLRYGTISEYFNAVQKS